MTRLLSLLVLSVALSVPAQATDDNDGVSWAEDDLEALEVKTKEKKKVKKGDALPERRGPSSMGEEPEEEFDLFEEPDAEPEDDFDEDDEPAVLGEFGIQDDDDDDDFEMEGMNKPRKTASKPAPKGPGPIAHAVAGKQPLADNYPLSVVAIDRDSVVVELPVLIARSRVGVEEGFTIIAEVHVGNDKVAQVSQMVTPASLAEFGPTFAYIKVLAPVMEAQGEVVVHLKRAKLDGSDAQALFSRSTPYSLK